MTLFEQIDGAIKEAMKAKNEVVVSALRMVKSAMKNKQIDLGRSMTDEESIGVLRTIVKQYKDALKDFENAGRTDLAAKQKAEIELLEHYLPAPITGTLLEDMAKEVIAEMNATSKDIGKTMGAVMKKADGRADGNEVRLILQKLLS